MSSPIAATSVEKRTLMCLKRKSDQVTIAIALLVRFPNPLAFMAVGEPDYSIAIIAISIASDSKKKEIVNT